MPGLEYTLHALIVPLSGTVVQPTSQQNQLQSGLAQGTAQGIDTPRGVYEAATLTS